MVVVMMALLVFSTGGLAPSIHDLSCREVPTSGVGHDATNLIRVGVKIPHSCQLKERERERQKERNSILNLLPLFFSFLAQDKKSRRKGAEYLSHE